MYLKRKIDTYLKEWKNDPKHKPLIIKGARQIGKTESIKKFAKENYDNVVEINFALENKYLNITQNGYTKDEIIKAISKVSPDKKFNKKNTLIFFDEIQDFPDIATSLKSFCYDENIDVICSGSLLGLYYKKIESNSVGYKTDYIMRSMDFEEFLFAKGYNEDIINELLSNMLNFSPIEPVLFKVLSELFLDYVILGGMPEVVSSYIENNNFSNTLKLQRQLINDYEEDITKYADGMDQARILNVFRHITPQLAKENKKFQISKIAPNARYRDYRGAIDWLSNAGIINICYLLNFPEFPLKGNYIDTKYKIYMADTGLLVSTLEDEAQDDLRVRGNIGIYTGALYENIIADMLTKEDYSLYYYMKENSTLEEDFFIRTSKSLIPIEVKSKNGNTKSLKQLISNNKYPNINFGIKLINGNIRKNDNIITFPHFVAFLLKRWCKLYDK